MNILHRNRFFILICILGTLTTIGAMELPAQGFSEEQATYYTYDSNLWSIHGQSIEADSKILRNGLEALQLPAQTIFERLIPEADRQILYTFYALSKHRSWQKALAKQTFEQIASLARSFHRLGHTIDIRPYFAANLFSASGAQIADYCKQKSTADDAAIDGFVRHPQFMYQKAPFIPIQVEKIALVHCGKNPILIASALWSINPDDEREFWYTSLINHAIEATKKLTKSIATLCTSEKEIFIATDSGTVLRPYYDSEKILCDEIVVCDHPITHMATTQSGTYIVAANPDLLSIIVRSNGSYITHKIAQLCLQTIGVIDTKKGYRAIVPGTPRKEIKKNLLSYIKIVPKKDPLLITQEIVLAQEAPQQCIMGAHNVLHYALKTKSGEWALSSLHTNTIPELTPPAQIRSHIPQSTAQEIGLVRTNHTGTLSIAFVERDKIGKSWAIWDHTVDEIHELPDNDYDVVVPERVAANGDISVLAGNNQTGYVRITIKARPHLSYAMDPKSSFKSKLLLLAAVGAHCIDGLLSIEDDPQWKEPFSELPENLQETLTTLYPVHTKSLLGRPGKSIIK